MLLLRRVLCHVIIVRGPLRGLPDDLFKHVGLARNEISLATHGLLPQVAKIAAPPAIEGRNPASSPAPTIPNI
jgi:hypothetical protein